MTLFTFNYVFKDSNLLPQQHCGTSALPHYERYTIYFQEQSLLEYSFKLANSRGI